MDTQMTAPNILEHNRVILCHFDSYSAALHFARYGDSILAPAPLSAQASAIAAPEPAAEHHSPAPVIDALAARYGLDPAQLQLDEGFEAWLSDETGPVRVHLVRFTTFDAPHAALEPLGGVFKPISQMRGMPPLELNLMRQVFNLIIG
jgi:hypothetical protein